MQDLGRGHAVAAGLALVLAPLAAFVLKAAVYAGWMMFIAVVILGVPLLAGYAMQIVVAINGMFRPEGVFSSGRPARRGIAAAWLTSVGVLLVAFFLVDGGDDGNYGSAFTELVGLSSRPEGENLSMVFAMSAAAIWLAGWLWLVVEWGIRLGERRRARKA